MQLTRIPHNWLPQNMDHAHDVGFIMGRSDQMSAWWPQNVKWAWNLGVKLKNHLISEGYNGY